MKKLFYQPKDAWVGDLIPYWEDGTFYGFYLHDPRIKDKEYAVTAIGDNTFKENTDITSVTMPNTVESLGNHTFYNCTKRIKMSLGGMSPLEYRRSLGIAT